VLLTYCKKPTAVLSASGLVLLAVCAAALPSPGGGPAAADGGRLVVHEWGTFLSVQGSDGVTLGGMVDSEELLPVFVRERSLGGRNRACFNQKGETPVTYFYTDRPRTVQVRVDMPKGLLTHWFPAVNWFGPPLTDKPENDPAGSFLDWGTVELIPDTRPAVGPNPPTTPALRPVSPQDSWRFARETDAAFVKIGPSNPRVRSTGEFEKFLFYRGLGTFELPFQVHSEGREARQLTLRNRGGDTLQGVHAIRVEEGTIQFAALPDLPGGAEREVLTAALFGSKLPFREGVPRVKQAVAAALVNAGLYPKEAQAMVNTWEKSYFQTDGMRMLYVLPRKTTDEVIPLRIQPAPQELVRVMVGRVEVLTPALERQIEQALADLGSREPAVRKAAGARLARLGRLQEPVLHRMVALTQLPEVRDRAETLIKQAGTGRP
jgi:hypothetical protein